MEIVLLTSTVTETPRLYRHLGPYQIAWYLRQHGYTVQVIDFAHLLTDEQLNAALKKFVTSDTKIFGFSFMGFFDFSNWWVKKVCKDIIPKLKKRHPQLKVVTGGSCVHDLCRLERNGEVFDYCIYGHAEDTLLALCDRIFRNGDPVPFEISFGNRVIREHMVPAKFNICNCSHRWSDQDCIQQGESLPIEISRGCIFKCKFCRYPYIGKSKDDFTRSMDELKDELLDNYSRWGITNYFMLEDTFNDRNDKLKAFEAMTKTLPFQLNYAAYLRPDLIWSNPGQAELLENSGLNSCFLGVETFNPEAADLIGKGWSGKHGKNFLLELNNNIWQARIPFLVSMIVGLPGDTKNTLQEHNNWLIDNQMPNWRWHLLNVNRDLTGPWVSEFDRNAKNYGFEWELWNGKPVWKTKYMTYIEARELRTELDAQAFDHKLIDCWAVLERANLGYDPKTERYRKKKDVANLPDAPKRIAFVENYFKDLMSIV